jgi:hypothetical protein
MTGAGPEAGFSLTYELQPGDFKDLYAAGPKRKRRRAYITFNAALGALFGVVLTAITVALNLRSVVKDSSGAPGWMYVVDAVIWFLVVYGFCLVWWLSPKRLARRAWRSNVQLHGRHHDEVGPGGVTCTAPDGTQIFIPWTSVDGIRETKHAFQLIDHQDAVRTTLPKRGLSGSDLIPALREFLNRSIGRQPPTVTPDTAADQSKP